MAITDEAWDYPDCMPSRANNSIALPARIQRLIEEAEAKRAATALAFARECHVGQLDKAGGPYVEHVERVARRLLDRWPDATPEEVAAAALHDAIEDTDATRDDINARFGPRVAEIVAAVTRPAGVPCLDWIGDIAALGDPGVLRVKLADLADNADTSRPDFPGRQSMVREKYAPATAILEDALARLALGTAATA